MPKPSVDWAGQRVLVTGGRGFLGRHIVAALQARGADAVAVGRAEADLCDQGATEAMVADVRPHSVIHCAVEGGGIGWMRDHPVESGLNSTRMNVNILSASQQQGVALFVGVSSACVYPRLCPVPFAEADIWNGYPEPINGPYALSKRLMMDLGAACTRQYGLKTVFPILANLYGPHDHTDSRRAHVVADLMIRCAAQPDELVVWGTGGASREFLFVEDAAEGILAAAAGPAGAINIGSGVEVSILDLARAVLVAWGLSVPIRLDRSKPDGQPRKCLSVERAAAVLGWRAPTGLADGLAVTAGWYGGVLDGGDSRPSKSRGGDKVVASKSPLTLARENLQLVDVRAADVDQISDKLIGPVLEWLGYEIRDEGHCRMNVELHPFLAPALWAAGTDGHVEVLVWHQSPMLWTDSKILLFAIQDAIRTPQWRGLKWVAVTDGDKWEVYSASSEPKERPTILADLKRPDPLLALKNPRKKTKTAPSVTRAASGRIVRTLASLRQERNRTASLKSRNSEYVPSQEAYTKPVLFEVQGKRYDVRHWTEVTHYASMLYLKKKKTLPAFLFEKQRGPYFSKNPDELRRSKEVSDGWYREDNFASDKQRKVAEALLERLGISLDDVKIEFEQ